MTTYEGEFEKKSTKPEPVAGKWSLQEYTLDTPFPEEVKASLEGLDLNKLYRTWRKSPYHIRPDEAAAVHLLARYQQNYDRVIETFKDKGKVRPHEEEGRQNICPLNFEWKGNVLWVTAKFEFMIKENNV